MPGRKVYLANTPRAEALAIFLKALAEQGALVPGKPERVPVDAALGRVTAGTVYARRSVPHYPAAAMDGVALAARETFFASETSPRRLVLGVQAWEVDTGDALPPGTDAVVMAEELHYTGEGTVEVLAPVAPGDHVRQVGEDVVAAEMLLPANHRITPYDLGGLLAGGVMAVDVHPQPIVGVIPTGDELVSPEGEPGTGEIPEFNSRVIGGLVSQWGGRVKVYPITPDRLEVLKETVERAVAECHVVIINAGSSAGREDYTARVIGELGTLLVHGVGIKPGKPVALGIIGTRGVVGIPGYPVSAALTTELFVRPVVYRLQGLLPPEPPTIAATLARKVFSALGKEEYIRVKLGQVGERLLATPISRGAGVITSLMRADGLLVVPGEREGLAAGERVEVTLLRPLGEVGRAVIITGSHDLSLDVLASRLQCTIPGTILSSANVGSLGGLLALRRGEAHGAGIHLLDPETGDYNTHYVRKYLPGIAVCLVHVAYRQQGLMVPKGNPLGITGLADLARPGIRFVNRQAGAGTRILLDYLLNKMGLAAGQIHGYNREEYTHLAVAVAVQSGSADAGMGIFAAAKALGLDFIPLAEERYDLCIPQAHWDHPGVAALRQVLLDPAFQAEVAALGGYDLRHCGQLWIIQDNS